MKVAYLSGGPFVPSARFRLPFYELLRERGHECTIMHSVPEKYDGFRWLGWRLSQRLKRLVRHWHLHKLRRGNYDAVVLDRGLFHTDDWSLEQNLRRFAKRIVLEVDDAVFLQFPDKMAGLAALADHVIAGNEPLAEWLRPHARSLSTIPTCVDVRRYAPKPQLHSDSTPLTIGWIGSAGNVAMLNVCSEALRRLAQAHDYRLRVISGPGHVLDEVDLRGVDVEWVDYRTCDEVNELHQMDIGIMPLPDDQPYMQYKCNAKMVQYLTVGLPAVGSAIGYNHTLIQNGTNGFLAADNDQWYGMLARLIADPQLRTQVGQAARESMLATHTVQSRIEQFEAILCGRSP